MVIITEFYANAVHDNNIAREIPVLHAGINTGFLHRGGILACGSVCKLWGSGACSLGKIFKFTTSDTLSGTLPHTQIKSYCIINFITLQYVLV